jgi:hypothetical protein
MKHAPLALLTFLLPLPAFAHETGLGHVHPHTDWRVLTALGILVAVGALAFLKLRQDASTRKSSKDKPHDPR